ncbi:MAG TPA: FHA domain-containing protein [Aggregatilineales bacterium]|jgi:DNA-binding winged helix-turn-helix (wHTH) protein|nr:FHA domain-containing protein [Aggregatilineales bacterium]
MSNEKNDKPVLVMIEGNMLHHQWLMDKDAITVGRDDVCDVVIPERKISRQHVRIYRQHSDFFIEDLNSSNGTWVNGKKLEGTGSLFDGDEINLSGEASLRFFGPDTTITLPSPVPIHIGGRLRLDREARRVFIGDKEIDPPLSLPQYRLLELLYISGGNVCTRDAVIETVWPDVVGDGVSEQAIDALVRRLRDRLTEYDEETQYIHTVRGHGFRFVNSAEEA